MYSNTTPSVSNDVHVRTRSGGLAQTPNASGIVAVTRSAARTVETRATGYGPSMTAKHAEVAPVIGTGA